MMIIKSDETYATAPDGVVPLGWVLVRAGFATQEEAQQWLWDAIDSIPEGWGLP